MQYLKISKATDLVDIKDRKLYRFLGNFTRIFVLGHFDYFTLNYEMLLFCHCEELCNQSDEAISFNDKNNNYKQHP